MERRALVVLVVIAVLVSAALAWATLSGAHFWRPRAAELHVASEQRSVEDFQKIDINGSAEVMLVQGSAPSVVIETTADAPVSTHVRNGTLVIDTQETRHGWRRLFNRGPRASPKITVTFRELTDLEASGSVKVRAAGIRTPSLHVDISGAGNLDLAAIETERLYVEGAGTMKATLAGHAREQRVEISGAGNYQALQLASDEARVEVSGAGNVVVSVVKSLRVDISGAGAVSYAGNPSVQKSISGMGNVRQLQGKGEVHVDDPQTLPAPQSPRHPRLLIA